MISFDDFKKSLVEQVCEWEFKDEYDRVYKRDRRATTSLNKTLETNYRAVYRTDYNCEQRQWKADDLDMDCGDMFVVTEKYKLLKFTNSEWFFIDKVKYQ